VHLLAVLVAKHEQYFAGVAPSLHNHTVHGEEFRRKPITFCADNAALKQ